MLLGRGIRVTPRCPRHRPARPPFPAASRSTAPSRIPRRGPPAPGRPAAPPRSPRGRAGRHRYRDRRTGHARSKPAAARPAEPADVRNDVTCSCPFPRRRAEQQPLTYPPCATGNGTRAYRSERAALTVLCVEMMCRRLLRDACAAADGRSRSSPARRRAPSKISSSSSAKSGRHAAAPSAPRIHGPCEHRRAVRNASTHQARQRMGSPPACSGRPGRASPRANGDRRRATVSYAEPPFRLVKCPANPAGRRPATAPR